MKSLTMSLMMRHAMLKKKAPHSILGTSQWAPFLLLRDEMGPSWQSVEAITLEKGAKR